jgi:hypothetical protein
MLNIHICINVQIIKMSKYAYVQIMVIEIKLSKQREIIAKKFGHEDPRKNRRKEGPTLWTDAIRRGTEPFGPLARNMVQGSGSDRLNRWAQ